MCAWLLMWVLLGLDWVLSMMQFQFCTSHVHAYVFFSFSCSGCDVCVCVCVCMCVSLSLSRIDCAWHLSVNLLWLGTFLVLSLLLLILPFSPSSHLIPWWEGPTGLPWELLEMWRSSEASCYPVELFRHSFTRYHSDLGMGFSMWETLEVSHHVYIGVLLQYTQYRYLYTSVCHDISRYTYRSYPESYIQGTTYPKDNAS